MIIATVIIAVLVLAGLGVYFMSGASKSNTGGNSGSGGSQGDANVKTFKITGENFRFFIDGVESPDVRVKQGDKIRIDFTSTSGFHDWVVDEFGAKTERVNSGGTTSVEFVANKKGTFVYYCSVGEHRQMGMKGNLIVE